MSTRCDQVNRGNCGDLISVIIPVKNSGAYLRECLDSVRNQTYSNLEIVVVVSPSTDTTLQIVCEYALKDPRIRVCYREHCLNVAHARQIGISVSTGDFIGFVDSDDVVHPRLYEVLMYMMTCLTFSQFIDIVQCQFTRSQDDLGVFKTIGTVYVDLMDGRQALLESSGKDWLEYTVLWNKLWRRRLFSGIVFPDTDISEEQDVVHRIFYRAKSFCRVQTKLYYWREHSESITGRPFDTNRMNHIWFGQNRLDYYDQIQEAEIADLMAHRLCLDCMWTWDEMTKVKGAKSEIRNLKRLRRSLLGRIIRSHYIPLTRRIIDLIICATPKIGHIAGMRIYD